MLVFLFMMIIEARAASYRCSVEFGERVLLASVVGQTVTRWNDGVFEKRPSKSLEKWTHFTGPEASGRYLTRYGTQAAESFELDLTCAKTKCQASFRDKTRFKTIRVPKLYDTRVPGEGRIELQFTQRTDTGLLVRLFRGALSSSGEVKFFSAPERFSLDVGVDEEVVFSPNAKARLAVLETKIDCRQQ